MQSRLVCFVANAVVVGLTVSSVAKTLAAVCKNFLVEPTMPLARVFLLLLFFFFFPGCLASMFVFFA